ILRRATRETEQFYDVLEQASNLPSWLSKRLKKDWGEQLAEISYELKQVAPLTLRVNTLQVSRDEYLEILEDEGIEAHACEL
ncbi:16S rRNA (cytosine(967)-C(5))-methyltransferase RsmB, partial [bacterium LRH843]|nr:16S rRNA (cytosine(967)-C(5))-methyltransferase RsmB [bacterium LRH843]